MSFEVLNKQRKLLPVICKPYPNEILSSWLTRLAFKHGLNTTTFCQMLFQNNVSIDVDRNATDIELKVLSERTELSIEEIRQMTLWSFQNQFIGQVQEKAIKDDWLLMGKRINFGSRKVMADSGILFCPGCFRKGQIHFKKEWRIGISFVCESCACYLLERCPHCHCGSWLFDDMPLKADQSLDEYLITCHNCGRNVSEHKLERPPEPVIIMQRELYRISKEQIWMPGISVLSYFKVLYELADVLFCNRQSMFGIGNLARCAMKAHPDYTDQVVQKIPAVKFVPVKWRWKYVIAAYQLLKDWPNGCQRILKRCYLDDYDCSRLLSNQPDWFTQPIVELLRPCPWDNAFQKTRISQPTDHITPITSNDEERILYDYEHNDNCFYDHLLNDATGTADVIEGIYRLYGFKPSVELDEVYQ